MSRELLERARDLIIQQEYDAAREILEPLQDRSSTARRWLANLPRPVEDMPTVTMAAFSSTPESSGGAVDPAPSNGSAASYDDELPVRDDFTSDGGSFPVRWEYREIILNTWEQHLSNIDYALSQGGDKITIEDAYTRLLNEHGSQGWEVVSEEMLPAQRVRLLLKRPVY